MNPGNRAVHHVRPLAERFWEKVEKSAGCWLWTAAKYPTGYGMFAVRRSTPRPAHRVAWELTNGPIPVGLMLCHACDVPACVRPDHLFLGTAGDNARDCARKGRCRAQAHPETTARGERNGNAKLSVAQVLEVRRRIGGESQRLIAEAFGVSRQIISEIARGNVWKHLRSAA